MPPFGDRSVIRRETWHLHAQETGSNGIPPIGRPFRAVPKSAVTEKLKLKSICHEIIIL